MNETSMPQTIDLVAVLAARPIDPLAIQTQVIEWLEAGDDVAQEALARARRELCFDGSLLYWDFVQKMLRMFEDFLAIPAELRAEAGQEIAEDTGLQRLLTRRDLRLRRKRRGRHGKQG